MDSNHPRPALGKGGGSDKKEEELAALGSGTTAESQVSVLPPRYRDRYRPAPKTLLYSPRYRSGTCHVLPPGRASTRSSRYYRWVSGTTATFPGAVLPLAHRYYRCLRAVKGIFPVSYPPTYPP